MTARPSDDQDRRSIALSDQAIEQLVHLHSGRATEYDREAFKAWRLRSPDHETAASEAETLWHDLAGTQAASDHSAARARFDPGGSTATGIKNPRPRLLLSRRTVLTGGIAASLAAVVVGSGVVGPVEGLFADYTTQPGELRKVELPDGSTALLNSATALSVEYSSGERRLKLHSGEALFEVIADAARPFTVNAVLGEVRAVGTVFSVRRDDGSVRVIVPEGTVEVTSNDVSGGPKRVTVNQQTRFDAQGVDEPMEIDVASATAWTRRKLIFNKRPLIEVVAELQRYRAGWIVIANKEIESLEVSGVFDLNEPGKALASLETILEVKVVRLPLLTVIRS